MPLIASAAVAVPVVPAVLRLHERMGALRENYRGLALPAAAGIAIPAAALVALGPLAVLDELAGADLLDPSLGRVLAYALGVTVLGLIDDLLGGRSPAGAATGAEAPRGWRGHAAAAARGDFSSGALKAVGALGLALYVMAGTGRPAGEYLVAVAVLVLSTNVFNLLDLRPGRASKAFFALGAGLTVATWDVEPLQTLGLLVGPALVLLPYDLRERAMLGDAGSNLIGALAGLWLVLSLSPAGEAVALAVLVVITVYAEFRSISALVERNPLLRRLDSVGRRGAGAKSSRLPRSGRDIPA